jgi:hypothetical protein
LFFLPDFTRICFLPLFFPENSDYTSLGKKFDKNGLDSEKFIGKQLVPFPENACGKIKNLYPLRIEVFW